MYQLIDFKYFLDGINLIKYHTSNHSLRRHNMYNNAKTQRTFPIAVNPIVKKQPESNGKRKCSGQCENCPRCSSKPNQKTESV